MELGGDYGILIVVVFESEGSFKMGNKVRTDFLFEQPSLLSGVARVIDLWGSLDSYNQSEDPEQADCLAMYADWRMVGQDLMEVIDQEAKSFYEAKERQLTLNIP